MFECDKCGRDGTRYTVLFEDGALILDRCDQHNRKLEALREEQGEWRDSRAGKSTFHKSSPDEIRRQMQSDGAKK